MKCPIPFVTLAVDSFPPEYERRDCLKEECAWWHEGDQSCSIKDIAENFFLITLSLSTIALKMPPGKDKGKGRR